MKTFKLVLVIFTFLHYLNYSQITKGHWLIGGQGDFSYTKTKYKDDQGSNFQITGSDEIPFYEINLEPNIGYFLRDKFAVGIKIGIQNSFNKEFPLSFENTQFSLSPFLRYYLLDLDKKFNLFVEPSYYYYTYKPLGINNGYAFKLGYVSFLNEFLGLELSLNYQFRDGKQQSYDRVFFGIGLQLYLEKE